MCPIQRAICYVSPDYSLVWEWIIMYVHKYLLWSVNLIIEILFFATLSKGLLQTVVLTKKDSSYLKIYCSSDNMVVVQTNFILYPFLQGKKYLNCVALADFCLSRPSFSQKQLINKTYLFSVDILPSSDLSRKCRQNGFQLSQFSGWSNDKYSFKNILKNCWWIQGPVVHGSWL